MKKKLLAAIGLEVLVMSLLVIAVFGSPFVGTRTSGDHPDPFPELPPWPPASVSASNQSDGVLVEWVGKVAMCAPSNVISIHHYSVYRRESRATAWTELHREPGRNDCSEVFQFLDTTAEPGVTYVYGVSVVMRKGQYEGLASELEESSAVYVPQPTTAR